MMKRLTMILMLLALPPSPALADLIDDVEQLKNEKQVPKKQEPEVTQPPPVSGEEPAGASDGTKATPSKSAPAKAKPKEATPKKKRAENAQKEPIRLKSDGKSTYSKSGGVIHLVDNVVITQADLRFQADEAKVFMIEGAETDNNVDRVEVSGNVRVSKFSEDPSEKVSARGDKAFFYNEKRKVTLVGNARLWQGGHLVKGKQISYDLDTGMITVDRAEGVVQPGEGKEGEKPEPEPTADVDKKDQNKAAAKLEEKSEKKGDGSKK